MALASWPARQGQQRSLRKMRQDLSWHGRLAGGAEPGVSLVGVLLRGGLVPAPVRGADVLLAEVAVIAQREQAAGGQLGDDAPDPGGGQVVHGTGQRPGPPVAPPSRSRTARRSRCRRRTRRPARQRFRLCAGRPARAGPAAPGSLAPGRADPPAVPADDSGGVIQGLAGQRQRAEWRIRHSARRYGQAGQPPIPRRMGVLCPALEVASCCRPVDRVITYDRGGV
jgi:hypothetical protein